jgi:hypothetical protein
VGEPLREVAQELPRLGVDLLGVEPHVVGQPEPKRGSTLQPMGTVPDRLSTRRASSRRGARPDPGRVNASRTTLRLS